MCWKFGNREGRTTERTGIPGTETMEKTGTRDKTSKKNKTYVPQFHSICCETEFWGPNRSVVRPRQSILPDLFRKLSRFVPGNQITTCEMPYVMMNAEVTIMQTETITNAVDQLFADKPEDQKCFLHLSFTDHSNPPYCVKS